MLLIYFHARIALPKALNAIAGWESPSGRARGQSPAKEEDR